MQKPMIMKWMDGNGSQKFAPKLLVVMTLLLLFGKMSAQNCVVSGTVSDEQSNPIPAASV